MSKNLVVCQDGCRVRLESAVFEGWIKPKNVDDLQTYSSKTLDETKYPGPKWIGSKMPAALMQQVLGTIHEFPRMETAYTLYYNTATREWAVKCPDQSGAGASVHFYDDGTGMPEGFTLMGSIHTHPEMGAFWSGTDLNDQQFKAGLHIVFGLRNGLVSQYKCTGFFPSMQQDQELWDVLEEVDFGQVYEPVAEWVETIKKQAYHPPVRTTWYGQYSYPAGGGYYSVNKDGSYTYHYGYPQKPANQCYGGYGGYGGADYGYGYGGYGYGWNWGGKKDKHSKHNKQRSYWRDYWDDYDEGEYDYDLLPSVVKGQTSSNAGVKITTQKEKDDDDATPAAAPTETQDIGDTTEFKVALLDALNDPTLAARLVDVFTDPDVRQPLEMIAGLSVTDTFDKSDVLLSIETFMTGETVLADMDDEEARQIFEGLMDLKPDLNVVDSTNALGNDTNITSLCNLMVNAVNAYTESECVSSDVLNEWLRILKDSYEALLTMKSAYDNPEVDETGEEQC